MNTMKRISMTTRVSRTTAIGAAATLVGGAGSTLLLALSAAPAGAATTWSVDTLADGAATASDCTTPVPGSCSLRDALAAATVGDTINFASSLFSGGAGTITLTAGDLIDNGVDIIGPGAELLTIDADGSSRVFDITPQASGSTISGVTLTGGSFPAAGGGAVLVQGSNVLTVTDSVVTGNDAFLGAGIYAQNLVVTRSTVSDNAAGYLGGGILATSQLVISNSTISGNSSLMTGGGVTIMGVAGTTVTVTDSTVSGNTSQADGGIAGYLSSGTVEIANSTFTGNTATGQGGAIGLNAPMVDISMSTITGNSSSGTDPFYSGGGVWLGADGGLPVVTLTGTVVAGNVAGVGGTTDLVVGESITDVVSVDAPNSFIGSGVTPNITLTGTGLLRGDAPMLGALADNGGSTLTMLPLEGSPLIDAGPAVIPPFTGNEFDQRGPGFPRVVGTRSDIGAVEAPGPVVPSFTG